MESVPFSKLIKVTIDNRGKTCPTAEHGIPLIATNCVKNTTLYPTFEKVRYVSEETYENWFRGHPLPGDIIFVNKGSPGQVCLTPDPVPFCIAQDMVAIRPDEKLVYPMYLFAALRSARVQRAIGNMHVGTMIPHFKKGDFDKLHIPIPDRQVQVAIGDFYIEMSKKIELNRRMNETLEGMARALFKDWFVDFGPTRAKMESRAPYLPDHIWSLFPDTLGNNGLPLGWEEEAVHDQANWVNGAAYKNMHFSEGGGALPVIKIAELKNGVTSKTKWTATELGDKYRIDDGELLFSWSGNPDTSINCFLWTGGPAWLNQHIFAVRNNGGRRRSFLFPLLKYLMPTFAEIARDKQTTGLGHVTKGDLKHLMISVGTEEVRNEFDQFAKPIMEQYERNLQENKSLAQTRDYVLPKLMLGEISVELKECPKETQAN